MMTFFSEEDILQMPKVKRLNIINSITGIKPANLISTIDERNRHNLAIFSSVVHLGSNPALIGFILRPQEKIRRHTYENILEKAGVIIKVEKEIDERSLLKELFSDENSEVASSELKEKTTKELEELLKIAIQNENYESAAKIRDEISNR